MNVGQKATLLTFELFLGQQCAELTCKCAEELR